MSRFKLPYIFDKGKMRIVQFMYQGKPKLGLETKQNGDVIDLNGKNGIKYTNTLDFLKAGGDAQQELSCCMGSDHSIIPRNQVKFLSPITNPDKVICIGMNYKDHCEEQGAPVPIEPIIFNKFPSTITGPYDDIQYTEETMALDWEVELAVVIGKAGKRILPENALEHVFGYTVAHDVSARDWQLKRNGGQWLLGKTMDTFCPLGPAIVTADELKDPYNLAICCRVNGTTKQDSSTKQIIHKVGDLISFISRFSTLLPGDVILTGTPPGVGCFRKPPEYLKKGDTVECEIEGIGTIINKVV